MRKGRARGGRIAIAAQGERAHRRQTAKWLAKMKREHPAEYAEAMRRLEEQKK